MTDRRAGERPSIVREVAFGGVAGIIAVVYQVSYATVIFSGHLTSLMAPDVCPPTDCFGSDRSVIVSHAISLMLFGTLTVSLITAFASSFHRVIAVPQGIPAVILSLMATSLAAGMVGAAAPIEIFATVVAVLVGTTLLAGGVFWAIGRFGWGRLVRYVPYPVIGGFLAGSGGLFVLGGIGVMTGLSLSSTSVSALFHTDVLLHWLPGVLLAVVLMITRQRWRHFLVLPLTLIAAIGAFYLAFELGLPFTDRLQRADLLLGRLPEGTLWRPDLVLTSVSQADWAVLFGQIGNVAALILVSVIALLVSCTGIELSTWRDLELDRELKAAGLANMVAGLGGSQVGYHDPSLSTLDVDDRAETRIPGVMVALVAGGAMLLGGSVLPLLPRPLLGGLLVFLGLIFLHEWVLRGWTHHAKSDYLLIISIAVVIVAVGVLEGVALGIVLAAVLFTTNYSRINVVRQALSGDEIESNVDRPVEERRLLRERGERIHVLRLQGFIFFGTAHRLYEQVKERALGSSSGPLRFLILDFRRVIRIDSSAENSLIKILRLAHTRDIEIIMTHLLPELQRQVSASARAYGLERTFEVFPDLDRGLEHCEERLLTDAFAYSDRELPAFDAWLSRQLGGDERVERLLQYLQEVEVLGGEAAVHQGEPSDALYLLRSGQLYAQLQLDGGQSVRLRSMRAGAIVGEIGLLLEGPRSTSVLASEPSVVLKLSTTALQAMEEQDPDLAQAFHHFLLRTLAERLVDNARVIRALSE